MLWTHVENIAHLFFSAKSGGELTEHDSQRGLSRAKGMLFDFYAVQHDARLGLLSSGEALLGDRTCCKVHKNRVSLERTMQIPLAC